MKNVHHVPDELQAAIGEFEMARQWVDTAAQSLYDTMHIGPSAITDSAVYHLEDVVGTAQGHYISSCLHVIFVGMKYKTNLTATLISELSQTREEIMPDHDIISTGGGDDVRIPDELQTAVHELEMARARVDITQRALREMCQLSPYRIADGDMLHKLKHEVHEAQKYYTRCFLYLIVLATKYEATLGPELVEWRQKTPTFM